MEVEKQCDLFREIILTFFDDANAYNDKIGVYADIHPHLPPPRHVLNSRAHLESRLPKSKSADGVCGDFDNGYLPMKPVTHGTIMLPMLGLNYNFARSIPEIRLRVGLFMKHENEVRAIGYRFESPEGIGRHHFYHVQMINGFKKDSFFPPGEKDLKWLPDKEPTFPLDAQDSVDLVLCLITALYGDRGLSDTMLLLTPEVRTQVAKKANDLKVRQFSNRKIMYYWRVTSTDTDVSLFFETDYEPDDFHKYIGENHENCRSFRIMPDEWRRQSGNSVKTLYHE